VITPCNNAATPRQGFTLVELLVVLAIIAIVASLTVGLAGTLKGSVLSQATDELSGYLREAHQIALTNNRKVEVRFYQYGNPLYAGEIANLPSSGKFRAVWLFQINDQSVYAIAARPLFLPQGIIIDSGVTLSSLIAPGANPSNPIVSANNGAAATDSAHPLPGVSNAQYVGFHFNRDGTTDLGVGNNWFLTLHATSDGDALTTAPKNYASLRVDPVNGSVMIFRP
jgi:uncharacterized protein (TIGR02596 family)